MKDSRDLFQRITDSLAAVESEITHLRDKARMLDTMRERLKKAQSVLIAFQGENGAIPSSPSYVQSKGQKTGGASRAFQSEGQTATRMRYVYGKSCGSTVLEAAKRTGVSTRRTWTAFERLRASGYMIRSGDEYGLTPKGIEAWQNSPLFGKSTQSA